MSEDNPTPNPSEGSIPPVEPIVVDESPTAGTAATSPTGVTPPGESWSAATSGTTATVPPAGPTPGHILMPKWVVFTVVGIALAALGFGVGWIAKPDSDSSRPAASTRPFGNVNPFGNNGPFSGNDGGNNGGGSNGGIRAEGAFLGVSAKAASGDEQGVAVAEVVDDSPADDAGLESGDIIVKVDDTDISSPAELVQVITSHDSGDEVTIAYTRDGETKTADVTLGDRSDAPTQLAPSAPQGTED